jgi:hypothetical protein
VSSQGKSFGNRNVSKNVNDNSSGDFLYLDSITNQQKKKAKLRLAGLSQFPLSRRKINKPPMKFKHRTGQGWRT